MMTDKSNKQPSNVWMKPVPMKLFAAWEVDKTPPYCIPRLCTLTLTRLVLLKSLSSEVNSLAIAVKMQSSKRTLRTNEIMIPSTGLLDTELDLTFSLQYPHFLKRTGNQLQIMLQRRKRYKNRAILGFKTLAGGIIDMAEVLQRPTDKELELYSDVKEKSEVTAKVTMLAVSSQPVDHEEAERQKSLLHTEQLGEGDNFSDDDEDSSSNEEGSDSEAALEVPQRHFHPSRRIEQRQSHFQKVLDHKLLSANGEERPDPNQRNIKQKFIALLKKFRVSEAEVLYSEQYPGELEQELINENPQEIEQLLFDESEDLSDSCPECDDVSISSTPKPSLRPFFSSCTLSAPEVEKVSIEKQSDENVKKVDSDDHQDTDQEHGENHSSPPKTLVSEEKKPQATTSFSGIDKEKKTKLFSREKYISTPKEKKTVTVKDSKEKNLATVERSSSVKEADGSPRKLVMEQLNRIFPTDDAVPDHLLLINTTDGVGQYLAQYLQERQHYVVAISSASDLKASVFSLVAKIQKFCNCNSRAPPTIKICSLGPDGFLNSLLRLYVDHFSCKPPEWQTYVRFHIVPLGSSIVTRYLGSLDSTYSTNFVDGTWKDLLDRMNESQSVSDVQEMGARILNYLNSANSLLQLPIAEAMVTYKEKSSDEESLQVFLPFISDVKIGLVEGTQSTSVDFEESVGTLTVPSGSPPSGSLIEKASRESITPPSSPSVSTTTITTSTTPSSQTVGGGEPMDLQLDYWTTYRTESSKKGESNKFSLKSTFRTLQISRLPNAGESGNSSLTLNFVTKEKRQKIMRLGKKREKERETENRYQVVDGVHRLICACKNPQAPLKVTIDGLDWSGVKFFQLTAQWQTHVKFLPVAMYANLEANI
ncbi:phosphofurin acidic cluster sorting protein KrT95D [Tachypleus tridentatus]|uniref:phosphofurin acidic cluster sorting protein KrT95D n=1 Tax=Tachypleus tridentatus TaxID=6853 RepID=UPI003FD14DC0